MDVFNSLYDIYFPLIVKKFNPKYHCADPWFTSGLLVSRREKIRLDHLASSTKTAINIERYKTYRNLYNKTVRNAKRLYFDKQIQANQTNIKQTWKILRCAINKKDKKSNTSISSLICNNKLYSDPCIIADKLNEYFCSEPQKIVNDISPTGVSSGGPCPDSLNPDTDTDLPIFQSSDLQVGHEEIFNAISQLEPKTSTDFNNFSMKFIKNCFNYIVNPFLHIVNLSFSTGCFPSQLKVAKVIPILKSGDPRLPNNYRPISLLSNFSKIIEKIMSIRLLNYIEHHNLFSNSQFGFRKNHSTIHPMVLFDNFISDAVNNKKYALAIFCDLRKAFDTVDHSILIQKLEKIGG